MVHLRDVLNAPEVCVLLHDLLEHHPDYIYVALIVRKFMWEGVPISYLSMKALMDRKKVRRIVKYFSSIGYVKVVNTPKRKYVTLTTEGMRVFDGLVKYLQSVALELGFVDIDTLGIDRASLAGAGHHKIASDVKPKCVSWETVRRRFGKVFNIISPELIDMVRVRVRSKLTGRQITLYCIEGRQ